MCRTESIDPHIDLLALLAVLENYILIKKDDFFPLYVKGSDIDLLVFDREECVKRVVEYYNLQLAGEGELRIVDTSDHCHLDFLFDDTLDLRLDLIDNFDFFGNIAIKPAYLTKLFIDRHEIKYGGYAVWVPCPEDDLTLRYFEYLEWFDRRPDKIKHLEYISAVQDHDLQKRFFANTHCYIQFKRKTWQASVPAGDRVQFRPESRHEALVGVMTGIRYLVSSSVRRYIALILRFKA